MQKVNSNVFGKKTNRVKNHNKNTVAFIEDVRYLKSMNSGHGKKGQWDSLCSVHKELKQNLDLVTIEDIKIWCKNKTIESSLKWFNNIHNYGWF